MIRRFRGTIDFYFSDAGYTDLAELCARLEELMRRELAEYFEAIVPGYPDVQVIEDGPFAAAGESWSRDGMTDAERRKALGIRD